MMASCSADEGTEPGSDSKPVVTLYSFVPEDESYDPDNDVTVRFAQNNKVDEIYYYVENAADVENYIDTNGEESYIQKILAEGTKLSFNPEDEFTDVTLTGLLGDYTISAVAVRGNKHQRSSVAFTGVRWTTLATGVYKFGLPQITGITSNTTELQRCDDQEGLYRFKNVYGSRRSLTINMLDLHGNSTSGAFTLFRVPRQDTGFTFSSYGAVYVQDVGYWQDDESFVTNITGYQNMMYDDYYCTLMLNWCVSAGNLASPGYFRDTFTPNP